MRGSRKFAKAVGVSLATLRDVVLGVGRPHLIVRAEHAKGGRPRRAPLWWGSGTSADLAAWKRYREDHGARATDPFGCSLQRATYAGGLNAKADDSLH